MNWILLALVLTLPFGIAALTGAPWLPTLNPQTEAALALADLKPGQTIIDLGSGDGRLLKAAAKRGLNAIGYEINPYMYLISLIVTFRYRRRVKIHLADFWTAKLPEAEVIYVFLLQKLMTKLEAKLNSELTRPTAVISLAFEIPNRQPVAQSGSIRSYCFDPTTRLT
jgi:SAM-dependent methyltransferase